MLHMCMNTCVQAEKKIITGRKEEQFRNSNNLQMKSRLSISTYLNVLYEIYKMREENSKSISDGNIQ